MIATSTLLAAIPGTAIPTAFSPLLADAGSWGHLLEFFTLPYGFVIRGLIGAVVVGVLCAMVGVYLVLRRMPLLGDAIGHAALPGVAGAFLIVGSKSMGALLIGALVAGIMAAQCVAWISAQERTRADGAIAAVLSVFFGFGSVLLSIAQRSESAAQSGLQDFLFGNAAAVSPSQLVGICSLACVALIALALAYRPLTLATFDPQFAGAAGINTSRMGTLIVVLTAVAVVVSVQAVGVILVAAMLVIPSSTALLVSRSLPRALALAAALGAIAGVIGSAISYAFAGVATGPSMVLVSAALFGGVLAATNLRRKVRRRASVHEGEATAGGFA